MRGVSSEAYTVGLQDQDEHIEETILMDRTSFGRNKINKPSTSSPARHMFQGLNCKNELVTL